MTLLVTSLHFTSLHFTSLHFTSLHFTSLHFTSLHFASLRFASLHFTLLYFTLGNTHDEVEGTDSSASSAINGFGWSSLATNKDSPIEFYFASDARFVLFYDFS